MEEGLFVVGGWNPLITPIIYFILLMLYFYNF